MPLPGKVTKVVGLDASTRNIGYCVMAYHSQRIIASGTVRLVDDDFYKRLELGPLMLWAALSPHLPNETKVCVIEHAFFTTNPETGKQISYIVGACLSRMRRAVPHIQELAPTEIKKASTWTGKAEKKDIRAWVKNTFRLQLDSEDEADAIAIAYTFITLHKQGYFKQKRAAKQEKFQKRAAKSAAKKAGKTRQPLKGELDLWQKEPK